MAVGTYILTTLLISCFVAVCYTLPDTNRTCKPEMVLCPNTTRCIPRSWLCDGDHDCPDKTDEVACESTTCGPDLVQCSNTSQCIPKAWICDGDMDCRSGSDEADCDKNITCSSKQFMCLSNKKCIPNKWLCDGQSDCQDGSDELNCANKTCPPTEFTCKTSGKCVSMTWRCDGDNDCGDGSDELNCDQKNETICMDVEFMCVSDKVCIHKQWRCDGETDCADKSDEQNCTTKVTCTADQFQCDNKTCIDGTKRCNGVKDCFNGRDETRCLPGDVRVLLADRHSLKLVTLTSDTKKAVCQRISHSRTTNSMVGVDYDYGEGYVFWSDVGLNGIYSGRFLNSSSSLTDERPVVNESVSIADGLAVDWINNLIYWTDTGLNKISVTNYNGTLRKTLIQGNLDEPRAIVVDPFTGWMYWTDWGMPPKIERAGMDGQQRETIVSTNLTWPNGLTLDMKDGRLYWIDSKLKVVESSRPDGTDRRVISKGQVNHGFGITTSEYAIYITSWQDKGITGLTKFDGRVTRFTNELTDSIVQPMGLKLYSNSVQKQKESVCHTNEFECMYLCLPRPATPPSSEVRYTCACPDGSTCEMGSTTSEPESSTVTSTTTTSGSTTTTQESVTSTTVPTTSQAPDVSTTTTNTVSTATNTQTTPISDASTTVVPASTPATRSDIECLTNSISLHIPLGLLPTGQQVTWQDPSCVVADNGTHLVGTIGLGDCGTYVVFNSSHVTFENELVSSAGSTSTTTSGIDYGSESNSVIVVQCVYPRRETGSTAFRPVQGHVRFFEKTIGHMQVHMRQARDATFADIYPSQTEPREVHLNDKLYIKLTADQGSPVKVAINVDRCLATPSPSPLDTEYQELTNNGCPAIPSVSIHNSSSSEVHLSFRAFQFRSHPGAPVYVHCEVYVCPLSHPQCVAGCTNIAAARTRRAALSDVKSHLVSTGPFPVTNEKEQGAFGGQSIALIAVTGLCACLAVVATVFGILAWKGMRRQAKEIN